MNKKIVFFALLATLLVAGASVFAAGPGIQNPIGIGGFPELLQAIAKGVAALVGGIGVIMIIVAGILYLTSAGSPEKIGTAKKALTYAIIGIAIGLAAPAIVSVIEDILKKNS